MMIDTQAAGQAFEREMQAKEQAKPIRQAGTRRSVELDTMSPAGAQRIAEVIRQHWSAAGYDVHIDFLPRAGQVDLRSNLVNGLPRQREAAK